MIEPKFLYLKKTEKEKNKKGEVLEINSKWQKKEKKEKVQHLTSFSKSRVWEGEIDSCKVTKEDKRFIFFFKYCNDVTVLSFLSMTMS